MELPPIRHWIFDLDGTLTLAQHDFDAIRVQLGIPQDQLILEYMSRLPEAQRVAMQVELDALEADIAAQSRLATGAVELLEAISTSGLSLGILTRNTKSNATITLEATGLSRFFEPPDVLGRYCSAPKPSPEGLHRLLDQWSGKAEEGIMVGDFEFDLQAGRAAKVRTAHVHPQGNFEWPQLSDFTVHSLTELVPLVNRAASN